MLGIHFPARGFGQRLLSLGILFLVFVLIALDLGKIKVAEAKFSVTKLPAIFSSSHNQNTKTITTSDVGTLSGNFTVTPTGASSYSIPISVPPGTADIAPLLTITYDSQQGNGPLGMGFSLEGLSLITRCPSNIAQNGAVRGVAYTAQDRFCLNGQQLVAVQGAYGADSTEYRTYLDSGVKIISYGRQGNGPASFKVWSKAGQVAEYGLTADSQILAQGKATVATWALDKISDTAGNYELIKYNQDQANGAFYPSEIDYTGNDVAHVTPYNSVKFNYAARPDKIEAYRAGSVSRILQRLASIQVFTHAALTYTYKLNYEQSSNTNRSRIKTIQECEAGGVCLPPTNFTWQTTVNPGWQDAPSFAPPDAFTYGSNVAGEMGDFNGDGLPDFVVSVKPPNDYEQNNQVGGVPFYRGAWINTGSGWQSASQYLLPDAFSYKGEYGAELLDVNGDGLSDYLISLQTNEVPAPNDPPGKFYERASYLGSTSGWQYDGNYVLPEHLSYKGERGATFGDFNGDGLPDFVISMQSNQLPAPDGAVGKGWWRGAWLNTGNGWSNSDAYTLPSILSYKGQHAGDIIDLNGDGLSDYVLSLWTDEMPPPNFQGKVGNGYWHGAWLNTGSGWQEAAAYELPEQLYHNGKPNGTFADLNGDGLPDFIIKNWSTSGVWINTGAGWQEAPKEYLLPAVFSYLGTFADVNGDGLADYIHPNGTWLNTGSGWQKAPSYQIAGSIYNDGQQAARLIDLNGDGMVDYVYAAKDQGGGQFRSRASLNTQLKPDLLLGVQNGLGANLAITYKPIVDRTIYQPDHDAKYPVTDLKTALYVVTQTISDTAANDPKTKANLNGAHITNYSYRGAKSNVLGWGFLGFRQITIQDPTTGIISTSTYSQDVNKHNVGQPLASETRLADGTLITATQNTWSLKTFGNGQVNSSYYLPELTQTVSKSYELNGNLTTTKTTTTSYDDYANPTSILVTVQDSGGSYKTTTVNTYNNDAAKWLLGELVKSVVTAEAPATPAIIHTSSFSYDQNTGMLLQTIREPDDAHYKLTTSYERDQFGNIVKTTVAGKDIATRASQNVYDATGCLVIKSINTLGQASEQTIDPRFGVPLKATDPNGVSTSYKYDGFGRLIATDHPDGTSTTVTYSWGGSPVGSVYSIATHTTDSITKTIYYDKLARELANTSQNMDGRLIWTTTQYDDLGRIVMQSLPYLDGDTPQYNSFNYDVLGRLTTTMHPDASVTRVIYNGLTTTTVNALNQSTSKIVNARGDLLKASDALGPSTTYSYDAFSNIINMVDSAGNVSNKTYDKYGRCLTIKDPDKGNWTYSYDVLGELTSQADSIKRVTTLGYDQLGRMISRTDVAGTSTWEYDTAPHGIGKLAKVNGVAGSHGQAPTAYQIAHAVQNNLIYYTRSYTYDDLGRLATTTFLTGGYKFVDSVSYDQDSRVAAETYPATSLDAVGLKIKNHYNELGFLTKITNATTGQLYWQPNAMDAAGQVISETHSNNLVTNYTYDPHTNFLTAIVTELGQALAAQKILFPWATALPVTHQHVIKPPLQTKQGPVQNMHYSYDALGNVKSRQDTVNNVSETFSYDSLNRLTQNTATGSPTVSYQYDEVGNLTYKSDVGTYHYDEVHAGPHAVTTISGVKPSRFVYDTNGDQIFANINGQTRTVSYTTYSKPDTIIVPSGASTKFYYNADRNSFARVDYDPVGKTYSSYYLGHFEVMSKVFSNVGHNVTQYKHYIGPNTIYVVDSDGNKNTYELLHDNLGSVIDITDVNGNVAEHFYYSPFGEQKLIKGDAPDYPITHHGFTGHEQVEIGNLIHMQGRIYDPVIGRFLSADPYVQNPENSQSLNRYSYCLNNPLAFTDPSGYFSLGHLLGNIFNSSTAINLLGVALGAASMGILTPLMPQAAWLISAVITATYSGAVAAIAAQDFNAFYMAAGTSFINAMIWHGVGSGLSDAGAGEDSGVWEERSLVHGLVGGGLHCAEGGNFRDGFIGAAVGEAISSKYGPIAEQGNFTIACMKRTAGAYVLGGTWAVLTGGNFANGAETAAYAELYNDLSAGISKRTSQYFSNTYDNIVELLSDMGPNAVIFGIVPLPLTHNKGFDINFLADFDLGFYHENFFWTDSEGVLHNHDYSPRGTGGDSDFPWNIKRYRFGPIYHNVPATYITMLMEKLATPPGFAGKDYQMLTHHHNCHLYSDTIRNELNIPQWHK